MINFVTSPAMMEYLENTTFKCDKCSEPKPHSHKGVFHAKFSRKRNRKMKREAEPAEEDHKDQNDQPIKVQAPPKIVPPAIPDKDAAGKDLNAVTKTFKKWRPFDLTNKHTKWCIFCGGSTNRFYRVHPKRLDHARYGSTAAKTHNIYECPNIPKEERGTGGWASRPEIQKFNAEMHKKFPNFNLTEYFTT